MSDPSVVSKLTQSVDAQMPALTDELTRLVGIPSVSEWGFPAHTRPAVLQAHDVMVELLTGAGVQQISALELPGTAPIITGTIPGPQGAPTVLLYGHYDVVGAGEESEWQTPPFEATRRGEEIFGRVLRDVAGMRDNIMIGSKCGIRWQGDPVPSAPHRYDFSAEHIVRSCEASLARLGTDRIDLYMLHRPDYLADPQEVASAFEALKAQGKVLHFGVSNFRPSLLAALSPAARERAPSPAEQAGLARVGHPARQCGRSPVPRVPGARGAAAASAAGCAGQRPRCGRGSSEVQPPARAPACSSMRLPARSGPGHVRCPPAIPTA